VKNQAINHQYSFRFFQLISFLPLPFPVDRAPKIFLLFFNGFPAVLPGANQPPTHVQGFCLGLGKTGPGAM